MRRVLLIPYPNSWRTEGGHRTQIMQTARALRRAGLQVAIGNISLARSAPFDVVHYFGDPRPLLQAGRPCGRFVVTPVHLPAAYELGTIRWHGGWRTWVAAQFRRQLRPIRHPKSSSRQRAGIRARLQAVARADIIVVNSAAEARLLRDDAVGPLPSIHVARSGVDSSFFAGSAERGRAMLGNDSFILCVGRVEPLKNQLTLARVMRSISRRLVLVGAVPDGHEAYFRACITACPSLVHLPHIERHALPHIYAAADVHVLPSWYETTGLATLEALAAGTPCVAGQSPCVEDYFSASVRLHRPGDERRLRANILAALDEPRGRGRALAARLTWDRTATEILDAYTC
jgi:glycosyltransferase involved in cell wall biosynthesis